MNSQLLPKLSHGVRRIGEVVGVLAKYGLADWLSGTELERSKQFFVGKDGAVLAKESHAARIRLAAIELGNQHQPAIIGRVEMSGEFGDLGLEFADRKAASRSALHGVFHGCTEPVFMYSIVAKLQLFSVNIRQKHREI